MADEISMHTDPSVLQAIHTFNIDLKERIDRLAHVTLNIAVVGETGAGKSTFINALRGVDDDDEGAAPTGVTDTTTEPTKYVHAIMPNVFFWDLPGIGVPKFKAKKYLKDVKFETYDFFIIISATRFKEYDIMLAKQIKKGKKKFYFVRSKIDSDVAAEQKKKSFNQEEMLEKIRLDCRNNLWDVDAEAKVFLISSSGLEKYDFQKLVDTLVGELDENKGAILIQCLTVCSKEMVQKKKKMFMNKVLYTLSVASGAMIALPFLSQVYDISAILIFFTWCYYAFGLDEKSLKRLSERVNVPVEELKAAMKSTFAAGFISGLAAGADLGS